MEVVDEMPKETFDATNAGEGWKGLSFKDTLFQVFDCGGWGGRVRHGGSATGVHGAF